MYFIVKQFIPDRTNQGANKSADSLVQETLMDSTKAFLNVGKKIINEKLQQLNSDAEKDVAVWKLKSGKL